MNKKFIKTPLVGVQVHDAKDVGTRTVNLLMGEHAGEYVRGDIMDANAVIQAFDELKGNVDTNHDTLEELVNEIHANTDDIKVERNRAIAKENSIIDKIDNLKYMPYVSKTNMSSSELGNFTKYNLGATNFIISAMNGSNDARTEFDFGKAMFVSVSKESSVSIDYKSVCVGNDNKIKITNTGIRKYINTNNPSGSATEAFSTNGGVIDTTTFALKNQLDSYAKKTELPTKVSQLTNDSNFITTTDASQQYATFEQVQRGLNTKQDIIVPGNVNISGIESVEDIGLLRNIVRDLVRALKTSGLVTTDEVPM